MRAAGHRGGRCPEGGRRGHLVYRRDDRAGRRPADVFPPQRRERAVRRRGRRPGRGPDTARGRAWHPPGHGPGRARRGQRLVDPAAASPGRGPAHQPGNGQPGAGPHRRGGPALPALPGQHRDQRTRGRRAYRHRGLGAHRGRAGGLAGHGGDGARPDRSGRVGARRGALPGRLRRRRPRRPDLAPGFGPAAARAGPQHHGRGRRLRRRRHPGPARGLAGRAVPPARGRLRRGVRSQSEHLRRHQARRSVPGRSRPGRLPAAELSRYC